MPNAFVSKRGYSIIPFDRVVAIIASVKVNELLVYISSTDKIELVFESKADLEAQRNAFLAYLTPTTKPLI